MEVEERLADIQKNDNIDYLGTAELAKANCFIRDQGGDYIAELPMAVSIGIALPNAIVDLLSRRNEIAVRVNYRQHAYEIINRRLDLIASKIASVMEKQGYRAFPIPAAERIDDQKLCASFSHKLAANLSGLGWIGKSCLLITPDHGPRVRWTTVLTDAPLKNDKEPMANQCGDCQKCVDICPVRAFTGRQFLAEEPREARYKAEECDRYFKAMELKNELKVCGLCLYVCPFGMKRTSETSISE